MATYITLVNFTQKGIENIKESPNRLDAAKKAFQAMGAEIKDFFLVMGRYDIVLISKAPNDEILAKVALTLGGAGAVRTETFRAFTEKEYRDIIASLP